MRYARSRNTTGDRIAPRYRYAGVYPIPNLPGMSMSFRLICPIHTHRVGVFVNEDKQIVSMYADRFGLNYVQLHGNESPEYCGHCIPWG